MINSVDWPTLMLTQCYQIHFTFNTQVILSKHWRITAAVCLRHQTKKEE